MIGRRAADDKRQPILAAKEGVETANDGDVIVVVVEERECGGGLMWWWWRTDRRVADWAGVAGLRFLRLFAWSVPRRVRIAHSTRWPISAAQPSRA